MTTGRPTENDFVGVWGQSPYATRGEAVAQSTGALLVRLEDAFLRSLHPGRQGEAPLGLMIDHSGVHFDGRQPSDLETLLRTAPLDDTALLDRARACMAWMRKAQLAKYSGFDSDAPVPDPGYVLVVDQTQDDASVLASDADRARFVEMLIIAQEEHPGAKVIIKTHPETAAGLRAGYFTEEDETHRVSLLRDPVSPWALLEGAVGVYTVSSQLGFEAILAGHKPRVFGQPFYSGWGLTQDDRPVARRERRLTRAQLFAGAMILAPVWYDPFRKRRAELEDILMILDAQTRAWREDRRGWTAGGMRLWKRNHLKQFFGRARGITFTDTPAPDGPRHMVWASAPGADTADVRVEDGFVRSRGLGADLVPPLSLVCDDLGIYFDPTHPSRLEALIAASPGLRPDELARARALIRRICMCGLSKYNLPGDLPDLPEGRRILVPGQVEDDASILRGSPEVRGNADLLRLARVANPDAVLIYKPHPDVVAGLRAGAVEDTDGLADLVVASGDIAPLLDAIDAVWTMTSLTGFEALLRGKPVTTLGLPFYAGWGLTQDRLQAPDRRAVPDITLEGLVHATLIAYPRYRDPLTGLPCPPEVILDRLSQNALPAPGPFNRILSKLQGLLASRASLWR